MQLVIRTQLTDTYGQTEKEYQIVIPRKTISIDELDRLVYQSKCRIEKHAPDYHEHVIEWYVEPTEA